MKIVRFRKPYNHTAMLPPGGNVAETRSSASHPIPKTELNQTLVRTFATGEEVKGDVIRQEGKTVSVRLEDGEVIDGLQLEVDIELVG